MKRLIPLLFLLPGAAVAQDPAQIAAELRQEFLQRGTVAVPLRISHDCPHESPVNDHLLDQLLSAPLTDIQEAKLTSAWLHAAGKCKDPRISNWYRNQLEAAPSRGGAFVSMIVSALVRSGNPEDVAAVARFIVDPAVDVGNREAAAWRRAAMATPAERLDLFYFVLESGSAPPAYVTDEISWLLGNGETAARFRSRGGRFIRWFPERAEARQLIRALSTELTLPKPRVSYETGWPTEFASLLELLQARTNNSPELTATLEIAVATIREAGRGGIRKHEQ